MVYTKQSIGKVAEVVAAGNLQKEMVSKDEMSASESFDEKVIKRWGSVAGWRKKKIK